MQASATGWVDEADDVSSHNAAPNRWNGKLSMTLSISEHEPVLLPTLIISLSWSACATEPQRNYTTSSRHGAWRQCNSWTGNLAHMWNPSQLQTLFSTIIFKGKIRDVITLWDNHVQFSHSRDNKTVIQKLSPLLKVIYLEEEMGQEFQIHSIILLIEGDQWMHDLVCKQMWNPEVFIISNNAKKLNLRLEALLPLPGFILFLFLHSCKEGLLIYFCLVEMFVSKLVWN